MSLVHSKTWGKVLRSWGYEIRVDIIDNVSGKMFNEVLPFEKEPTATELATAIDAKIVALTPNQLEIVSEDGTTFKT